MFKFCSFCEPIIENDELKAKLNSNNGAFKN